MKGSSKFMNKDFGFSGILGGKQSTNPGSYMFFFVYQFHEFLFCFQWNEIDLDFVSSQTSITGIESKFDIVMVHLSPVI